MKTKRQNRVSKEIAYSTVVWDLGSLLVATTKQGICAVELGDRSEDLIEILKLKFNDANIVRNDVYHQDWIEQILKLIQGEEIEKDFPLDIGGTVFQQEVWQALKNIPYGETRSYQDLARQLNRPKATRAIGSACGANPVALLIPCHRVLRSDGSLGGYRWGIERKRLLLEIESRQR